VQQARGFGPGVGRESVGEVESKNSTAGHGPMVRSRDWSILVT